MAKLAPTSTKYVIKAHIKAKGVIEKPDVIGAIFGQTEGLLGSDLDLRELQRTGRIGRIEVNIKSNQGNSDGEIIIPSSLDSAETALIAATLETIERIGPCVATIELRGVEDMRSEKRKYVIEKAKDILKNLVEAGVPSAAEISEQIKEAVRTHEISSYHGLPCGPNITDTDNIVIVEGRADVVNLLKYGIRNVIAIEGTSVPPAIINLAREKIVTLFVDGDRGGQLILKEFLQLAEIDYVATAPPGKEVEELSKKEVYKALREKVASEQFKMESRNGDNGRHKFERPQRVYQPQLEQAEHVFEEKKTEDIIGGDDERKKVEWRTKASADAFQPKSTFGQPAAFQQTKEGEAGFADFQRKPGFSRFEQQRPSVRREPKPRDIKPEQKELFTKTLDELVGTRAACIFDSDSQVLGKVPVSELMDTLKTVDNPYAIVFDGKVDFRLNSMAKRKGVKILIGMEKDRFVSNIAILSRKDLEPQTEEKKV